MDIILNITAPIFFLILLGFLSFQGQLLPREALPAMSRFVLYLALPAVMVTKISALDLGVALNPSYMAVYAIGGLATFFVTLLLARAVLKERWDSSAISAMGAAMPNSSFIGFPILIQFMDEAPAQAFAMSLVVENILFFPVCLILIESFHNRQHGSGLAIMMKILKRVATNPVILSVVFGVLLSATGLSLPNFIGEGLNLLANAAAPVALIVIGGSLVGVTIQGDRVRIALVAGMKLLFFPALAVILVGVFPPMPDELRLAVIAFAAMPMFSIYPIIGGEYSQRGFCASTLLVTTVLSFITISMLLQFII